MGNLETGKESHHDHIRIYSHVERDLIRGSLKKGGPLAVFGAIGIIFAGAFMPPALLKIWGFPIFILGLILIGVGLNPYRKLTKLLLKPYEIVYDGSSYLFLKEGKALLQIPDASIESMKYLEKKPLYGLAIYLKPNCSEKVKVFDKNFRFDAFQKDSRARFEGCDLFLPYFTKAAVKDLLESDHAS